MKTITETDRLLIREFVPDDAPEFFAFDSDPDVMRHVGEPPSESVEQVREKLSAYPDYRERGYGRWAVVHKADGRVIGFNGLKYLPEIGAVDLGYRFLKEYWGQGIATESSRAVLEYGFNTLHLDPIIGMAVPENVGSIHVLKKLGMRYCGMNDCLGLNAQRWELTREMYDSRSNNEVG
jgi:RimJ/RimL family protein N-acetyltransferase